jgi:plastocyanin
MRRVFSLLLLTPILASCADSATPVAPAGAKMTEGAVSMEAMSTEEAWPVEENWFTADVVTPVEDQLSMQAVGGTPGSPAPGAVMTLGNPESGSHFGPPGAHDQSFQARDKINPGTVTINAGETVTFNIIFGHRLAIYNDGVKPDDIQPTPGPLLLYPVGRVFLQPSPAPQFTLRFVRPGKYLVVCAINQHFFVGNMWGWLIVK